MQTGRRHPDWIKVRAPMGGEAKRFARTDRILKEFGLNTVCSEAQCPNRSECWSANTATFMLLGDTCTRGCRFCAVTQGRPLPLDAGEPGRVADAAAALGLDHIVLTSVNRDDLSDQGSGQFAATVQAIKAKLPNAAIEVLIPDFQGDEKALYAIMDAPIDVLNHNTETVPRLYRRVRPGAKYDRSLTLLQRAAAYSDTIRVKTGLMLGLGEEEAEVTEVMSDIRQAGCHILTLGQYLQPRGDRLKVERYLDPDEFKAYKILGLEMGFSHVESGPLVRSSYHAWQHV